MHRSAPMQLDPTQPAESSRIRHSDQALHKSLYADDDDNVL